MTASWVILILFYKISVVNFVFLQKPESLEKELPDLPEGLSEYLMTEGDATELLFRAYVDPNKKYATGTPPWQFCSSKKECYDKLLDKKEPAKFFFTYEQSLRFEMEKRKACSKLTVFQPRSPLASIVTGMYYSSSLPKSRRVETDKAILGLRVEHKIQTLINEKNPALDCRPDPASIGQSVIFWLLLPIFELALVPIVLAAGFSYKLRQIPSTQASSTPGQSEVGPSDAAGASVASNGASVDVTS